MAGSLNYFGTFQNIGRYNSANPPGGSQNETYIEVDPRYEQVRYNQYGQSRFGRSKVFSIRVRDTNTQKSNLTMISEEYDDRDVHKRVVNKIDERCTEIKGYITPRRVGCG